MTYLNRDIIDDLLNNSDASNEDKKVVSSLFESVDYNVEEFLRTNYLEAIKDDDLKIDIIQLCFLSKKCIPGRYGVYVYLNSNSVILQSKECQAYHLDGSPIPIPQNVYLYPNCDYIGRIMIFEDRSIKSQPELIEIDGIKQLVHSNGNRGIMTTDCRILVPAICESIEMECFGVTLFYDKNISLYGKLWPIDTSANWTIRIPYDEKSYIGLNLIKTKGGRNEDKTWENIVVSLDKILDKVPAAYIVNNENGKPVGMAVNSIFSEVKLYGKKPITEADVANCEKEVRRIFDKHLKP